MIPNFRGAEDIRSILERLVPSARKIMLEHRLVYGQQAWSITALELYLWTGNTWLDPSTDRKPGQAESGKWYINYGRNPNFGRIDIAVGSSDGIFAGLLVRELDQEDGSAKVLHKIIRGGFYGRHYRWSDAERDKIASIDGSCVTTGPLQLVPREPEASRVWIGPRIFYTRDEDKKQYLKFPLRVAVWPTERLKTRMKVWHDGYEFAE